MKKNLILPLTSITLILALTSCARFRRVEDASTSEPAQPAVIPSQAVTNPPASNPPTTAPAIQASPTSAPPTQPQASAPKLAQPSVTPQQGPSQTTSLANQLDGLLNQLGNGLQSQDTLNDTPPAP